MLIVVAAMLHQVDSAAQTGPRPRTSPASWITPGDYPADALAAGATGTVELDVSIDQTGKPLLCRVILATSEFKSFGRTACSAILRRASFEVSVDDAGAPIAAAYRSRWRFERDYPGRGGKLPTPDLTVTVGKLPIPSDQAVVILKQIQTATGEQESCRVEVPSTSPALDRIACREAAQLTRLDPIGDAAGAPVRGVRYRRIQFTESGKQVPASAAWRKP